MSVRERMKVTQAYVLRRYWNGRPQMDASSVVEEAFDEFLHNYRDALIRLHDEPSIESRHFSAALTEKIHRDCRWFWDRNMDILLIDPPSGGMDFYLSRNGHGTGFWDDNHGYYDAADQVALMADCKLIGPHDVERGDDGYWY